MSWDAWIEMDAGGPEPMVKAPERWSNYTCNVLEMFAEAGLSMRALDGMPCEMAAEQLSDAIARLEAEPERFRKLNPPNGWGRYETAVEFLRSFAALCRAHPLATARVV